MFTHQQEIRSEGPPHPRPASQHRHRHVRPVRIGGHRDLPELGLFHPNVVLPDPPAPEVLRPVRVLVVHHQQGQVPARHRGGDPRRRGHGLP